MNLHIIFDFQHIYYKYFFQLRAGKLKHLTSAVEWNGSVIEKDMSLIYYPLRDIENIRRDLELKGASVTVSVCFDSKSKRSEGNTEEAKGYKSGRQKTLGDEDFKNIELIEELLKVAGHNTYKIEGYEADDLVNYLARTYKDDFDHTMIYTNDKDLIVNVDDKISVSRFKQTQGYTIVSMKNYEQYLENEFETFIPYNALGLFLSTVGDSADKIKGINKFGKVAFKKLITKVAQANQIDWAACGDYNKLAEVVEMCKQFLTPQQAEEMTNSFSLVANIEVDSAQMNSPSNQSTKELREQAYNKYKMFTLVP